MTVVYSADRTDSRVESDIGPRLADGMILAQIGPPPLSIELQMSTAFNAAQGHRFFSVECFNRTWNLIEKPDRSPNDDEQMLLLTLASLWHWTQRPDCTPRNLSIGYWQVSRVCALLGQAENARRFAEKCLELSADEPPFYSGYAHEALARAALLIGDRERLAHHLQKARELAAGVGEEDERTMLQRDLEALG